MRIRAGLVLLLLGLTSCTLGPVWAPRVEGRVVDALSGRPIAGALVSAYHDHGLVMSHGSSMELGFRTATTDADGRFVLPGRFSVILDLGSTSFRPTLRAWHPEYGHREVSLAPFRGAEIALHRDDDVLEAIRHPGDWSPPEIDRWSWICMMAPDCWRKPAPEGWESGALRNSPRSTPASAIEPDVRKREAPGPPATWLVMAGILRSPGGRS